MPTAFLSLASRFSVYFSLKMWKKARVQPHAFGVISRTDCTFKGFIASHSLIVRIQDVVQLHNGRLGRVFRITSDLNQSHSANTSFSINYLTVNDSTINQSQPYPVISQTVEREALNISQIRTVLPCFTVGQCEMVAMYTVRYFSLLEVRWAKNGNRPAEITS